MKLILLPLTFLFFIAQTQSCLLDGDCYHHCCLGGVCQNSQDVCQQFPRPNGAYCAKGPYCSSGCCDENFCKDGDNCKGSNAFLIVVCVLIGLALIAAIIVVIWKRKAIFRSQRRTFYEEDDVSE